MRIGMLALYTLDHARGEEINSLWEVTLQLPPLLLQ